MIDNLTQIIVYCKKFINLRNYSLFKSMSLTKCTRGTVKRISKTRVISPLDGSETSFDTLWKDQKCVFIFFRRWRWLYSKLVAREVSAIQPLLTKYNIKLIGIGFEHLGAKEFIKQQYFEGNIFIDERKEVYQALNLKRIGYFQFLSSFFSSDAQKAQEYAGSLRLRGNVFGGVNDRKLQQNGGCLVVDKGGGENPLLHHISRDASDRVQVKDILRALNITEDVPAATPVIMKIG